MKSINNKKRLKVGFAGVLAISFLISLPAMAQPNIVKTFAVVADFGCDGAPEEAVAGLVNSWAPDFIISPGDATYGANPESHTLGCPTNTLDDNVGKYFADYLYPYTGLYPRSEEAPEVNRFYPVPGNHDYEASISEWESYFNHTDPITNSSQSKRYYDFKIDIGDGDEIHFFGINTNVKSKRTGCDPNGNQMIVQCDDTKYDSIDVDGAQYTWLKTQLEQSTARFKVVFMHMSPYSSLAPGDPDRDIKNMLKGWPFSDWGVDVVLAGDDHYYERNWRHDMPFIVAGLGGHPSIKKIKKEDITTGNLERYDDVDIDQDYGALRVDVIEYPSGEKDMRFQFITANNTKIDEFYLLPRKAVNFDFKGTEYLADKASGIEATSFQTIMRVDGYDNVPQSAIRFAANGKVTLPAELKEFLDPTGDGYTISCWVQIADEAIGTRQIFSAIAEDKRIGGFKRDHDAIALDRYVEWTKDKKPWVMETWNPELFLATSTAWHRIFMSVKEDMIRIKVYSPADISNGDWEPLGYGGHNELTYMGGQKLHEATEFRFGHSESDTAIYQLDNFEIYDRALNFRGMDKMFIYQYYHQDPARKSIVTDIVEETADVGLAVYPNPVRETLFVEVSDEHRNQELWLSIVNLVGVRMTQRPVSDGHAEVDVRRYPSGLYIVTVAGKGFRQTRKIIIR